MKSYNIVKLLKNKSQNKISIKTLGGNSDVTFFLHKKLEIICKNSKGKSRDISDILDSVYRRYIKLKKQKSRKYSSSKKVFLHASSYNASKWAKAPDRNFAPYVAAIIAYLDKEHPSYAKSQRRPKRSLKQPHLRFQ